MEIDLGPDVMGVAGLTFEAGGELFGGYLSALYVHFAGGGSR